MILCHLPINDNLKMIQTLLNAWTVACTWSGSSQLQIETYSTKLWQKRVSLLSEFVFWQWQTMADYLRSVKRYSYCNSSLYGVVLNYVVLQVWSVILPIYSPTYPDYSHCVIWQSEHLQPQQNFATNRNPKQKVNQWSSGTGHYETTCTGCGKIK